MNSELHQTFSDYDQKVSHLWPNICLHLIAFYSFYYPTIEFHLLTSYNNFFHPYSWINNAKYTFWYLSNLRLRKMNWKMSTFIFVCFFCFMTFYYKHYFLDCLEKYVHKTMFTFLRNWVYKYRLKISDYSGMSPLRKYL